MEISLAGRFLYGGYVHDMNLVDFNDKASSVQQIFGVGFVADDLYLAGRKFWLVGTICLNLNDFNFDNITSSAITN